MPSIPSPPLRIFVALPWSDYSRVTEKKFSMKRLACSGQFSRISAAADFRAAVCLMLGLLAGCGGNGAPQRPATAIAQGMVVYRGEPVSEAVVVFQSTTPGGYAASAMTDEHGEFDLKAFPPASGAVPGAYVVTILKGSQEDVYAGGGSPAATPASVPLIPVKYSLPAQSGLKAEIPESGTQGLFFDLKD